ncbi:hypothetical protein [Actinomadura sp. 9N407]|uniref:hypothetical protein n=1 Tax=Actinomadura sp. 9N407 TaxID=3375154 RepID=UPI00379965B7
MGTILGRLRALRAGREPTVVGSAVLRGGLVLGTTLLGFALAAAGSLWWSTTAAALITVPVMSAALVALLWLYGTRRPLRFKGVPLALGVLAMFGLFFVGVVAAPSVAMTLVGVDAEAVVERTWTTGGRGPKNHHCTLRLPDGRTIPREFAADCQGYERGDGIRIVHDPQGRFAPVRGPKADLPAVGQSQVVAVAGLVLLVSIMIGSVPERGRARRSRQRGPR